MSGLAWSANTSTAIPQLGGQRLVSSLVPRQPRRLPTDDVYFAAVACLSRCLSEIGKIMSLLLLTRLLASPRQLASVAARRDCFHDLALGLGHVIAYLVRKYAVSASPSVYRSVRGSGCSVVRPTVEPGAPTTEGQSRVLATDLVRPWSDQVSR
ncbi:unnamed protein product [Protopolystoma xenopodis]|uniref:Uncharacterized protein n=1 Tax=Protopolystoma xenopodis TaxID=117903 RepID=A0A448WJU2_9PLAT|nr:unnamed protein product [Protopolystoma xenopodis]